ncbi:threalose-6-phosphate phosphatase [Ceratobasidium sp. 370]|nr:threalose-6-phosphate phosphatase [Ceratobasidium sp. 370]
MDDYSTPTPAAIKTDSLEDVRAAIASIEAEHKAKGIALSGRIVHACHYLPIVARRNTGEAKRNEQHGLTTPPRTPDFLPRSPEVTLSPGAALPSLDSAVADSEAKPAPAWLLAPRRGHTTMTSGIRSLSTTHEQLIVGWTGEFRTVANDDRVPTNSLSPEDRAALEEELATYQPTDAGAVADERLDRVKYKAVWLDDAVAAGHYEGYCKTTLWPLFHYLLWQDVATEIPVQDEGFSAYKRANQAYANALLAELRPGDLIWVHDYHLLLLPRMVRAHAPDAHIGLFVHTPFPSSEVFRCLPRRTEILEGMLGANLTYSYSRHFASTCIRVCGYEAAPLGIDVHGALVAISHSPVGIDAFRVERDSQRPGIQPKLQSLRALYQGKKIIVGRDKLDAVKGVVQKLRAFEKLLQDYPEWIGNVVLIQVTSPALTDSPKLERQVSELVAHINGEYGSLDFIPVHHYHQTIKKDEFYALLSVADLALITPLRDGMNTTSMEFVICQQRTGKSPIVLSEFMGISHHMSDALQINPWNLGDVAAAINRGLTMTAQDKETRQSALYKIVTTHTSYNWAAMLVKKLLQQVGAENTAHNTPVLDRAAMGSMYEKANKRLLLFDYDGTLTPIVKTPSAAVPSKDTLRALEKLSADPKNVVYIISGRDGGFLDQHLGHLKQVGFSAEHGSFVREPGAADWNNLTKHLDMSWMSEVHDIFKYYTEARPAREDNRELRRDEEELNNVALSRQRPRLGCNQCLDLLQTNIAPKRPIEVLVGKKNLEVRPIAINKGEIVKRLMYANPDAEFVFCAGDDKTDEDMFRALGSLFPTGVTTATMEPPVSAALTSGVEQSSLKPVQLAMPPNGVFSTTVGASSKKTLARWHVTSSYAIVESMLELLGDAPTAPEEPGEPDGKANL